MVMFSRAKPRGLGVTAGRLRDCPFSPNCVCSDATADTHRVPAFRLAMPPGEAWRAVRAAVKALPRTRLVSITADYLHAECRSALLGFVDDLELHLRPEAGVVAVRSASRLGYSDLGVNRARVDRLREDLVQRGAIAADPGASPRER